MQDLITLRTNSVGQLIISQSDEILDFILQKFNVDNLNHLIGLEFLTNYNDQVIPETVVLNPDLTSDTLTSKDTIITFPEDGIFKYFKFIIPTLEYFKKEDIYEIPEKSIIFYKNLFFILTSSFSGQILNEAYLHQIKISDFNKYLNSNELIFSQTVASIAYLKDCLFNLQKMVLADPKNCNGCGAANQLLVYNRDFLLNAVYVLEHLLEIEEYEEANDLILQLSTCSGIKCTSPMLKKDCNCGKVV